MSVRERQVWFMEADQRAGRYHFEVWTSVDGMVSQYRRTVMATDKLTVKRYEGESSCQAAMRDFTEDVIKEVHG